ncbi:hypothetical protein QYE76_006793 [Lolium multiflorum]|uniref:Reverse transcriptase Ty1/copia-type domain-containing protein n=1 Tax=Lolium multiflorum TaxID=4521 RepID=A0AAD8W4F9_LOLMU|nr:hypothetical protein QYE76_006793 [Lolium multiflorum]
MENYSLLMGDSSVDGDGGGVDGGAFRGHFPSAAPGRDSVPGSWPRWRWLGRSEGKIFVAKNGSFLEKEFLTKEVTGRKVELDEVNEPSLIDQSSAVPEEVPAQPAPIGEEANDDDHETSNEEATEPRRSTRERTTPDWYDPCLNVMIVDNNDEDPATYEEAMMSPDSNKWQEAMKFEMGSMYDNKVWTLVDLPDSRKAVENKWIFKRKTDADGNITVYKARLVAKGFRQIQGVDYDETFSPVAKLKSVRILLAIAAFFDYEIWQMDVKMAFLNGDIEEELYMVQPKGFVDPENADKFWHRILETATALNHLSLYPLYLTSSEQFASSFSCSALAIEKTLLCNHGLLLCLFGSLLPILLLQRADAGVRPDSGVRGRPLWWDEVDWDFAVGSEDDESLIDGEDNLQFLVDGELEEESNDDAFSWGEDLSSDGEDEAEDDTSSDDYPPAAPAGSEDDDGTMKKKPLPTAPAAATKTSPATAPIAARTATTRAATAPRLGTTRIGLVVVH